MSQVAAGSKKADPLRQQLDELDQLMQRMLALEVIPTSGEVVKESAQNSAASQAVQESPQNRASIEAVNEGPPTTIEFAPLTAPVPFPEIDMRPQPVEPGNSQSDPGAGTLVQEPEPAFELALPGPTFVALGTGADVASAPLFADFQFAPPPRDLTMEPVESPELSLLSPSVVPIVFVAWWLRPLALVNRVYDGSTGWLGPIGRGLRSSRMRNLLGICGVAALVGALAWMLWEGTDWNS
jgi:hypothetical protein